MISLAVPAQLTAAATAAILVSICLASTTRGQAQEPGEDAKPLSEIVEALESDGYGPFIEISRDDGYWEVEVSREGVAYELTIDPKTGDVLAEHRDDPERVPPEEALPLSKLLKTLREKQGFHLYDEISFERRYWEIEVFQNRQKHEVLVDPLTAAIVADRIDD